MRVFIKTKSTHSVNLELSDEEVRSLYYGICELRDEAENSSELYIKERAYFFAELADSLRPVGKI